MLCSRCWVDGSPSDGEKGRRYTPPASAPRRGPQRTSASPNGRAVPFGEREHSAPCVGALVPELIEGPIEERVRRPLVGFELAGHTRLVQGRAERPDVLLP